jgi:hypothetical protein
MFVSVLILLSNATFHPSAPTLLEATHTTALLMLTMATMIQALARTLSLKAK